MNGQAPDEQPTRGAAKAVSPRQDVKARNIPAGTGRV